VGRLFPTADSPWQVPFLILVAQTCELIDQIEGHGQTNGQSSVTILVILIGTLNLTESPPALPMSERRSAGRVGKWVPVLKRKFESWYSELINPLRARSAMPPPEDQSGGIEGGRPGTAEEQEVSHANPYE
jgi:hypothetical protein